MAWLNLPRFFKWISKILRRSSSLGKLTKEVEDALKAHNISTKAEEPDTKFIDKLFYDTKTATKTTTDLKSFL